MKRETTLFRYEGEVVGPFESDGNDAEGMKEGELVMKDPVGQDGQVNNLCKIED